MGYWCSVCNGVTALSVVGDGVLYIIECRVLFVIGCWCSLSVKGALCLNLHLSPRLP